MKTPQSVLWSRLRLVALLALAPVFTGCAAVVVGGAVAGGAALATDRRTLGTVTDDQEIELRASSRISSKYKDKVHVSVTSYNRMALIAGEAPDEPTKQDVEKIVAGVNNVRSVVNELVIGPIDPGYWSNDAVTTSKVKARFVDANKFNALNVKVTTENGVVYLMGLVTRQEADDATQVARTTGGVKKVVRVFEYIQSPVKPAPAATAPAPAAASAPAAATSPTAAPVGTPLKPPN
ncbi:MAG: BON domain-containing protein [Burkholderiales bacterium]